MERMVQTGYRSGQSNIEEIDLEAQQRPKLPKPHPLETQNLLLQFFFFWVKDVVIAANKTTWTQDMHYDLPLIDQAVTTREVLKKSLSNKKRSLIISLLSCYKGSILFIIGLKIVSSVGSNISTILMASALSSFTKIPLYHNPENAIKVGLKLALATVLKVLNPVIATYLQFYADRVSRRLSSGMLTTLQDKIMRFSLLNSNTITQGFISDLIQVDVGSLSGLFFNLVRFFEGFTDIPISLGFFIYFIGLGEFFLFVGVLAVTSVMRVIVSKIQAWLKKKYLQAKDRRMTLLRNVLETTDFVKINGLENYFCLEMFERREAEIYWIKVKALVHGLVSGVVSVFYSIFPLICFRIYWTKVHAEGQGLAIFLQFQRYSSTIGEGLVRIVGVYSYYLQLNVSLTRLSKFLNSEDKGNDYLIEVEEFGGEPKYAFRVLNGSFKWRLTEDQELNAVVDESAVDDEADQESQTYGRRTHQNMEGFEDRRGEEQSVGLLTDTVDTQVLIDERRRDEVAKGSFRLKNINLDIKKGEKVAVIGGSSSGMSSLLYALIGEMIPTNEAKVYKSGSLSYLPQSRWLMGCSVKENITMGKTLDEELIKTSLDGADMMKDIQQLGDGIETLISDDGDNVSGGQKARIALARCFYQSADINLLDDPTSSLDNKVSDTIFENIRSHPKWRDKTFIVATKKVGALKYFDRVIFMINGSICFQGTFKELKKVREFQEFMKIANSQSPNEKSLDQINEEVDQIEEEEIEQAKEEAKNLEEENAKDTKKDEETEELVQRRTTTKFFIDEDRKKGAINPKIYHKVIHGSFGYILAVIAVVLYYYTSKFNVKISRLNIAWAKEFFNEKNPSQANLNKYTREWLLYYLYQAALTTAITIPISYSVTWFARKVHSRMFFSLIHSSPTKFLQRTSNGIIVNRFSNDINALDNSIVGTYSSILKDIIGILVLIWTIIQGLSTYIALIPLALFMVLSTRLRNRMIRANREVKRLVLITQSPIIGTSIGSIMGGPVIRAIQCQDYLRNKVSHLVNENTKNVILTHALHYWFYVWQEFFSSFLIFLPLYGILLWSHYSNPKVSKDTVVFVKFLQKFSGQFFRVLIFMSAVEIQSVSIERVDRYENLEPEKGYSNIKAEAELFKELNHGKLKKAKMFVKKSLKFKKKRNLFPEGRVRFSQASARYPTAKKNVLSDLELEFLPGQTVGIVGRTGAGKSSFTKLIWRALDPFMGGVEIDGTDISTVDVKELRTNLNVVLQKPSLFEGTLLSNLSNNQGMTNHEIFELSKELVSLGFPKVKLEVPDLGYEVKEGGSNLSQSERQIICLIKSFRNKSKVVILDEATAYVDLATENIIQRRVREEFKDRTVFIIAHKISNIMDADRILVFDQGRVVQDGSPQDLVGQGEGIFYEIWKRR